MDGLIITILLCLGIAACFVLAVRKIWKDKKAGKSCCGGNCCGCSGCSSKK